MFRNRIFSQKLSTIATSILLMAAAGACSLAIDTDPKGVGLGEICASDTDCHAGSCVNKMCVASCATTSDCPSPTQCFANLCQTPLKVRGLWVGSASDSEGWTRTHQDGIMATIAKLPYIVKEDFDKRENILLESEAFQAIDGWAADGANVIIANSISQQAFVDTKQKQYPNIKFLIATGTPSAPNRASFFGHIEQAWYVAGKIAASQTKTKQLGYVVSLIIPETVRHLNAFTLGALSIDPSIKVEVRYVGFWSDWTGSTKFSYTTKGVFKKANQPIELTKLNAEEYITAKLIDSGCDVIAHQMDNQRPGRFIEKYYKDGTLVSADGKTPTVWAIGNDNKDSWKDLEGKTMISSIGSVYWNWEPLYTSLLEKIQHKQFEAIDTNVSMSEDSSKRVVSFDTNPDPIVNIDLDNVQKLLSDQARKAYTTVYQGPWSVTDAAQRPDQPTQAAGQGITDTEWGSMCWFVNGVVERSKPEDPSSTLVPAKVPTTAAPAQKDLHPATAPEVAVGFPGAEEVRGFWACDG